MIEHIYIEEAVRDHPRTESILSRYPRARTVYCERYGEVFNPKAQNFRLQKQRPSLILARKHSGRVLQAPPGYGVGGGRNYYFSHMLNCVYDCRYCFLQGMYRSANYVVFVNFEDFGADIQGVAGEESNNECWFFSGYDCDSLAFDPATGFADFFLPLFEKLPSAWLELRTKSTQVRGLLKRPPLDNVVVAFSFTPQTVSSALEHKVPSVNKRIEAMRSLQEAGWPIALRFDPVIYSEDYAMQYDSLFEQVFNAIDADRLHSVSLGTFRLPRDFFKTMVKLYPYEPLFAGPLDESNSMVSYHDELELAMLEHCATRLRTHVASERVFPCEY